MKVCFLPFAALLLLLSVPATAQTCNKRITPSTPDTRFSVSGDEVTDLQTGLIWQRCSVGQRWDGTTCSGDTTRHNWSEALAMAAGDWRLPNIKELMSIVETACVNPAVNLTVFPFPATASFKYWSSSPVDYGNSFAWGVGFYGSGVGFYGSGAGMYNKDSDKYVRLVLGGQEASGFDD
jgi:hypothetical protein